MCLDLHDFNDMVIKLTKSADPIDECEYSPVVIKTILDMFTQLDDEAKFITIVTAAQKSQPTNQIGLPPLIDKKSKKPFFLDYKTLALILSGLVTLTTQLIGDFSFTDVIAWINEFISISGTIFFR